jgi:uncharacterized protein (DUF362 family)
MKTWAAVEFESYDRSVTEAFDAIAAGDRLAQETAVLVKPNLVNSSPHPVTTSPDCCEAVIEYVRRHSQASVVVAEGCGAAERETDEIFERLGYTAMAARRGVPLVDLNHEPVRRLENASCSVFKEMYLPEIAFTHYIISVPVLKAHSLAVLTGSLKNMMGFAPPKYYSGSRGVWKKAAFHGRMQESVTDLNRYLVPDLTVMDGSVGMAEFHLGGPHCDPPANRIIAGHNPWEVDREAAGLLGLNWEKIGHVAAGFGAFPGGKKQDRGEFPTPGP